MTQARLFHNADCSKCRGVLELLLDRGVEVEVVDYLRRPPDIEQLRALARMLDQPASTLLRSRGDSEATSPSVDRASDEEAVLRALVADPARLQRPIVVIGDRAVIARPPERVLELL